MSSDPKKSRSSKSRQPRPEDVKRSSDGRPMPSMKEFQDLRKKATEWWEQAAEYLQPIFGEISWERTWKHLHRGVEPYVRAYNTSFAKFCGEPSFFTKLPVVGRSAGKAACILFGLAVLQAFVPLLNMPLSTLAAWLGFWYVWSQSSRHIIRGWKSSESSPPKPNAAKSMIVCCFFVSALHVIPPAIFDKSYEFGAMWQLTVPVALMIHPDAKKSDETFASSICDYAFEPAAKFVTTHLPKSFTDPKGPNWPLLGGIVVGVLLWRGFLGATASSTIIFGFLAFATITNVGKLPVVTDPEDPRQEERRKRKFAQWYNLLAIWLWRFLFSLIEGLQVPGFSMADFLARVFPLYWLLVTAFLWAMLSTDRTEKDKVPSTWYAKMLAAAPFGAPAKPSKPPGDPRDPAGKPRKPK